MPLATQYIEINGTRCYLDPAHGRARDLPDCGSPALLDGEQCADCGSAVERATVRQRSAYTVIKCPCGTSYVVQGPEPGTEEA